MWQCKNATADLFVYYLCNQFSVASKTSRKDLTAIFGPHEK